MRRRQIRKMVFSILTAIIVIAMAVGLTIVIFEEGPTLGGAIIGVSTTWGIALLTASVIISSIWM